MRKIGSLLAAVLVALAGKAEAQGLSPGGGVTFSSGNLVAGQVMLGNGGADAKTSAVWSQDANGTLFGTQNAAAGFGPSSAERGLYFLAPDTVSSAVTLESFAAFSAMVVRRSGGTAAVPAATENGTSILALMARGHNGTAFTGSRAEIDINTAELWSGAGNGTRMRLFTTPIGATAEAQVVAVQPDGTLYVGATNSPTSVNTGAGTVNTANGYYVGQKNVTPGTLQVSQTTPGNPAGTTSATQVMMGLAVPITPQATSRIMVVISGDILNNTSGSGATVQIRWGTGTGPINGAASVGNGLGGNVQYTAAAASQRVPFSLNGIVTGRTPGTALWFDLGVSAVTSGTASVESLSVSVFEL